MLSLQIPQRSGSRPHRRELLRIGGLTLPGLSLPHLLALQSASARQTPNPAAKSCVFIFLFGGPSQLDLWDMKPSAPREIRGDFQPIHTSAPGIEISEHLPLLAGAMHHVCLVRSMHHRMPVHGPACSEIYSGRPYPLPPITDQARREDWPSLSALVTRFGTLRNGLPSAVVLPWHSQFRGQQLPIAGQAGGRMGEQFNPFLLSASLEDGRFDAQELQPGDPAATQRLTHRAALLRHLQNSVHPVFVWIWYHCGFWDGGSHAGSRTVPGDSGLEESMVGDECDAEPGRAAGGCVCGASLWHKILLSPVLTDTALLRPYCRAAVATP